MSELQPLDDDIRALLDEVKPIADLEPTAADAIFAAVAASIVLPSGGSAPASGGSSAGGSAPASGSPAGAGGSAPVGGLATTAAKGGAAKLVAAFVATFAVGVGTGLVVAPTKTVTVAAPPSAVRVEAPVVREAASIEIVEVPASVPSSAVARPRREADPPAPSARGLAAERRLLDVARAGLANGDASGALVAIDRHAREYPEGVLVEEREALGVKVLVALGRADDAKARAAQFEKRFPNGLMLRAVKGAVNDL